MAIVMSLRSNRTKEHHMKHALLPPAFALFALTHLAGWSPEMRAQSLSWSPVKEPGIGGAVTSLSICPADTQRIILGGDMLGPSYSHDGGQTWNDTFGLSNYECGDSTWRPGSTTEVWLGTMGGPYKSTDGGRNWVLKRNGMPAVETWWGYTAPIQKILYDPNNNNRLLAFGGSKRYWSGIDGAPKRGAVWESTNGGESWTQIGTIADDGSGKGANILHALFAHGSSTTLYAVAANKGVYKSTDGGRNWIQRNSGLPFSDGEIRPDFIAMHPTNASILWVSLRGKQAVFKTTNGGDLWSFSGEGLDQDWSYDHDWKKITVSRTEPNTLYVVNRSWESLFKSTNGGASWFRLMNGSNAPDAPTRLSTHDWPEVDPNNASVVYAFNSVSVFKSTNGGANWSVITAKPTDTADVWQGNGYTGYVSTAIKWNPYRSGQLWLQAMDDGKAMRTNDGLNWRLHHPGINWWNGGVDMAFGADGNTIYGAFGQHDYIDGLARSTNGGDSWSYVTAPGSGGRFGGVYCHPNQTNRVWVLRGGRLYYSDNSGSSWTERSVNGDTNLEQIASTPNSGTKFYIISRTTVYRTLDGTNFTALASVQWSEHARMCVDPSNTDRFYAAFWRYNEWHSGVYRYDNGNWTRISNDIFAYDVAVDPNDPNRVVYITNTNPGVDVDNGGGVHLTTNALAANPTWSVQNTGLPMKRGLCIAFNPAKNGEIIVGLNGRGFYRHGGNGGGNGANVSSQWIGKTVTLLAQANGKYVRTNPGDSHRLIADTNDTGTGSRFEVIDGGDGWIALRAKSNSNLVCAENGGGADLIANRGAVGDWERFRIISAGNGRIGLLSRANNKYVQAQNAGAWNLRAVKDRIDGSWEEFTIAEANGGGGGSGSLTRRVWNGVSGTSTYAIPLTQTPSSISSVSSFEAPTDVGDNYGQTLDGFVHPPESGNYTFWIAGDDHVELWLSTDDDPANARWIAGHSGWTSSREWGKYSSQKSAPISLTAGQKYYVRALMKEGGGGDNLAVCWRRNNTSTPANGDGQFIIPGSALSPWTNGLAAGGILNNGTYTLEPACAPGKRLDVAGGLDQNGVNVQIYSANGQSPQNWTLQHQGGGWYELIPGCAPGRRLDVSGGADANGTNVMLWDDNNLAPQRWRLELQSDGLFELIPQCAQGRRLDVAGAGSSDGTNVMIWEDNNGPAQRWKLIRN